MIVDDWKPKYKKPQLWKYVLFLLFVFIILTALIYEKKKWIEQTKAKPKTTNHTSLLKDTNANKATVQTSIDEQAIKEAHIDDTNHAIKNTSQGMPKVPFSIDFKNNKSIDFESSDGFNFKKDDTHFLTPLPKALENNLLLLKRYLRDDPKNRLTVIGLYTTQENNHSIFPNIGLARANQIKQHLLSLGFNSKQINLDAQTKDATANDDDVFDSMVDFSVDTLTSDALLANQIAVEKLKHTIKAKPLILKFAEGEAHIGMTPEKREKILNIINYVDKVKGSKLILTGHTDSLGQEKDNLLLAKQRATFVADFLTKNGLDRSKMKIVTRGEAEPIASNATDEGRAKNRRTVVTIE